MAGTDSSSRLILAPVAQRIEHRTSDARVGGSNPSGRATCFPVSGRITTTHTGLPDTNFDTNPKVDAIKGSVEFHEALVLQSHLPKLNRTRLGGIVVRYDIPNTARFQQSPKNQPQMGKCDCSTSAPNSL